MPENPDEKPNFNDFKPFAGWKKPTVKLYQEAAALCGVDVDLRYSWLIYSLLVFIASYLKITY